MPSQTITTRRQAPASGGDASAATKTVLIIGATGGIGGALAQAFLHSAWRVRALTRHTDAQRRASSDLAGVEWLLGDAMQEADVVRAAQGVECIVHAANPPGYLRWRELALPMLASSIAAARASSALLVFPGNVYNYGPGAGQWLAEDAPQQPRTRKGQVRVEMEAMLQQAAEQGVRSVVVRAGDFFGWQAPSSWFQTLLIRPQRQVRSVWFPGEPEVGHAWAYLPDLAQTIVRLVALQARFANFETFHFAGHWTPRSIDMAESIRRAVGNPRLPIRRLPWPLLRLAAPFVRVLREILEMRYLWREPLRLDNRKLLQVLGDEPHTPLDQAVQTSLINLGCLAPSPAADRS
ncbi:MAG: NAD-dependent epimerase/dehydratase family protein [Pseudomonadaceae bacterium]|nr:NAD-dependent epimerase/dehydratase family protein [Pseudomonadaceae bacterium]